LQDIPIFSKCERIFEQILKLVVRARKSDDRRSELRNDLDEFGFFDLAIDIQAGHLERIFPRNSRQIGDAVIDAVPPRMDIKIYKKQSFAGRRHKGRFGYDIIAESDSDPRESAAIGMRSIRQ